MDNIQRLEQQAVTMRPYTKEELENIREKIACPQFGDDHYGQWGALSIEQRKTIFRLLGTIYSLCEVVENARKEQQDG